MIKQLGGAEAFRDEHHVVVIFTNGDSLHFLFALHNKTKYKFASIKIFDLLPCAACFSAGRCQTSNSASPLAQIKNLVSLGSADGAREEFLGW